MKFTLNQLLVARGMAAAYGHEWASCPDNVLQAAVETQDVGVIRDAVLRKFWVERGIDPDSEAQKERSPYHGAAGPGICAPTWDETFKSIDHTTATGRIRWSVRQNGDVNIGVYRPEEVCVLSVLITPDADLPVEVYGKYHTRHIEALAEAIKAAKSAQSCITQEE